MKRGSTGSTGETGVHGLISLEKNIVASNREGRVEPFATCPYHGNTCVVEKMGGNRPATRKLFCGRVARGLEHVTCRSLRAPAPRLRTAPAFQACFSLSRKGPSFAPQPKSSADTNTPHTTSSRSSSATSIHVSGSRKLCKSATTRFAVTSERRQRSSRGSIQRLARRKSSSANRRLFPPLPRLSPSIHARVSWTALVAALWAASRSASVCAARAKLSGLAEIEGGQEPGAHVRRSPKSRCRCVPQPSAPWYAGWQAAVGGEQSG